MRRFTALLIVTVLGASGCAQLPVSAGYKQDDARFGNTVPPEADTLQPGTASYGDVTDLLGPPSAITALPDGFAFLYEGGELRNRGVEAAAYSLRAGYSWSQAEFSIAAFVFGSDGVLTGKAVERRADGTGEGFAIGTQKSDAADQAIYLLPAHQRSWGRQMLRRIPRTLNQPSNIDSGESGFERRGTTAKVGQRSLESGYLTAVALLDLLKTQTGN